MTAFTSAFNGAQTFFVDPASVGNASQAMISAVDLFFKHKPAFSANYGGAPTPGVTLFIAETVYGVPRVSRSSGIFTNEGVSRVGSQHLQMPRFLPNFD